MRTEGTINLRVMDMGIMVYRFPKEYTRNSHVSLEIPGFLLFRGPATFRIPICFFFS